MKKVLSVLKRESIVVTILILMFAFFIRNVFAQENLILSNTPLVASVQGTTSAVPGFPDVGNVSNAQVSPAVSDQAAVNPNLRTDVWEVMSGILIALIIVFVVILKRKSSKKQ